MISSYLGQLALKACTFNKPILKSLIKNIGPELYIISCKLPIPDKDKFPIKSICHKLYIISYKLPIPKKAKSLIRNICHKLLIIF